MMSSLKKNTVIQLLASILILYLGYQAVLFAVPLVGFQDGAVLTSQDLNDNFNSLNDAVTNIESAVACKGNSPDDIMVKVGPICVDKYEASVWQNADGTGLLYGASAAPESGLLRPADDYPCNDNGNDCSKNGANAIYAFSKANVIPSRYATWFQAQQACLNSGKRLLTNAEWQMVAAGTPDPTTITQPEFNDAIVLADLRNKARVNPSGAGDDGVTTCSTITSLGAQFLGDGTSNFKRGAFLPVPTGSRSACVSNWEVNDMIGNLWEWVADWVPGIGALSAPSNELYAHDTIASTTAAGSQGSGLNFPAAIYRGANGRDWIASGVFAYAAARAPSDSADDIGFRCAR